MTDQQRILLRILTANDEGTLIPCLKEVHCYIDDAEIARDALTILYHHMIWEYEPKSASPICDCGGEFRETLIDQICSLLGHLADD